MQSLKFYTSVLFFIIAASVFPSVLAGQKETETALLVEEVLVIGNYTRSIARALELKQANSGFSDSIVASDITEFPGQNLVEALQRIPGVAIERDKGLGTKVNVRGLPHEFTHVSINGIATASSSSGRDVRLGIFASDIIQHVTVQKSPTAAHEEGGIAGSVQISTARPFDFGGRKLVAVAEAAHSSISDVVDPKVSFLASEQFGHWGALVSFSGSQRTNRTDSNSGIGFRPISRWLAKSGDSQWQSDQAIEVLERDAGIVINDRNDSNETGRIVFLNKVGDRVYLNDQEKWGATASLQYKPSNNLLVSVDALLGNYDTNEDVYDAAAYSASSSSTLEKIHAFDATTLAEYGITVLSDVSYARTQHEFLSRENVENTDFQQYSLHVEWGLDDWEIAGVLGYSGASSFSDYANLKHEALAPSRTRYTTTGGETILSNDPGSIDMYNSPEAFNFVNYDIDIEKVGDDKYVAQFDFSKAMDVESFSGLRAIKFGARYTDESKTRKMGELRVTGVDKDDNSFLEDARMLSDSELQAIGTLVPGGAYRPRALSWAQVPNAHARAEFRYPGLQVPFQQDQFYRVDESVFSLYAMAEMRFNFGKVPLSANAGVRSVDTSVLSFGYHQQQNADGSEGFTPLPVSQKGDYKNVLPSINITADLSDNLVLRFAASETLIRPNLSDIAYKRTVKINEFKYYDGNPNLKPTYANQWELGLEYYLDEGGALAMSYFNKKIAGLVRESLTGAVQDVIKYNADGSIDGIYDFDVYQKINAPGSFTTSGVELLAQISLGKLSSSLQGFGINANFTLLDNSLTGSSDLGIPTPPEGLAEKLYNLIVYYEKGSLDARILYSYKDKYVEYIERDSYPVYRKEYGQYDISIGYQITNNINVSLKGINITNEKTAAYTLASVFPSQYEFSGRRIGFSVRANF